MEPGFRQVGWASPGSFPESHSISSYTMWGMSFLLQTLFNPGRWGGVEENPTFFYPESLSSSSSQADSNIDAKR